MEVYLFLIVVNVHLISCQQITFYTAQESQTLDLCSEEYDTYINKTDFATYGNLPDENDHRAKCLFFCVPLKLSITDNTGIIDTRQIKNMIISRHPTLEEALANAVVKKCSRRREADVCDKWYYLTKCIWNTYLNSQKSKVLKRIRGFQNRIQDRINERRSLLSTN